MLAFPEPGVDDTAAYQGYQTRFYRDSKGNTVQVYLEPVGGRVVNLWADAADESLAFTVRDAAESRRGSPGLPTARRPATPERGAPSSTGSPPSRRG